MSYVSGYDKIESAFSSDRAVDASMGDVFVRSETLPDLSLPVGRKIEKALQLTVPKKSGELAVAIVCRVVRPEADKYEGIVTPWDFSPWTTSIEPTMTIKQTIDWQETNGPHQARLSSGLARPSLEWADEAWVEYEAQMTLWKSQSSGQTVPDLDKPFRPNILRLKVSSERPAPLTDDMDEQIAHSDVLVEVAQALPPAVLGHIVTSANTVGFVTYQSPAQFEAHVDWLLS